MSPKRSLLRSNMEAISTASVAAETLRAQKAALIKAEVGLQRMEKKVLQRCGKVRQLRALLVRTRLKYREKGTSQLKRSCESIANKLKAAMETRNETLSKFREMKQLYRDERATYKKLERKEAAKQKAVSQFIRKWEREYDREIKLREKKAKQRERWMKSM